MFRETYDLHYSDYLPTNNERLEDRVENNKFAKAKVLLLFLVKKLYRAVENVVNVPLNSYAPNSSIYTKLCKYNELEYQIETSELQMEFYLHVMEFICRPRDAVFLVFAGRKVVCAWVVSSNIPSISIS